MKQVAYVLVGILVGFILAGAVFLVIQQPAGKPIVLEPPPTKVPIQVQVLGGVVRPGVYSLPEGSRVQDAVDAAGGLLANTDTSGINLAAKLEDGQQVEIPGGETSASGTTQQQQGTSPFTVLATPVPTKPSSADLININTATLAELQSLPNIGPTTAQNIVNYRIQHGPFATTDMILNVPGIGPATYDSIKSLITTGP